MTVLILALAFALGLVSLVLLVTVIGMGLVLFGILRKHCADLLVSMTVKEQSSTRILRELAEAEEALRPVAEAVRERLRERIETDTGHEVERPPTPRPTEERESGLPGVAPIPEWIVKTMEQRREDERRMAQREAEIAAQDTDAIVPAAASWDHDDRMNDRGTEQNITPARDSKLAAAPPG